MPLFLIFCFNPEPCSLVSTSLFKNLENLSDEEATKRLNQSFDVGQQLLNNRRAYAEKFLKILSPQQVLTLFQTEGKMREKMLDKKNDK